MSNKCGECHLFQGSSQKCDNGRSVNSGTSADSGCFKGPASLFSGKKCGGCRLFQGSSNKCNNGRCVNSGTSADSSCYAPIAG
ncbi:MAG: hypothetical protein FWD47_14555 [Treponema sp.]|nr:hypothetical protein [Treponema sp.]